MSSASKGRCRRISRGSVSAAITTNSEIPLFRVFVAGQRKGRREINTNRNRPDPLLHDYKPDLADSSREEARKKQNRRKRQQKTFVGALLELLVVGGLLDEVQYGDCELRIRQGVRFRVYCLVGLPKEEPKTTEE